MKTITKMSAKILLLSLFLLTAITAVNAQDARLRFENLDYLEQKARDVVEINIDGKVLELGKARVIESKRSGREKSRSGDQRSSGNLCSRIQF